MVRPHRGENRGVAAQKLAVYMLSAREMRPLTRAAFSKSPWLGRKIAEIAASVVTAAEMLK